jgi:hypothetical protein
MHVCANGGELRQPSNVGDVTTVDTVVWAEESVSVTNDRLPTVAA